MFADEQVENAELVASSMNCSLSIVGARYFLTISYFVCRKLQCH